jgi:hypothetical protein
MIIATRELRYTAEDGCSIPVPVNLSVPEEAEMGWKCHYTIGWPEGVEAHTVPGIDAIQALYLGLQALGTAIYLSGYHRSGRLCFDEPGYGYGFPVLTIARDMLIGDDSTFCG